MSQEIQFPVDFTVTENPFLMFATNYIYIRKDGSIISVLESSRKSDQYEIWDERWMEDIEIMSSQELSEYLKKEPLRKTVSQINWN